MGIGLGIKRLGKAQGLEDNRRKVFALSKKRRNPQLQKPASAAIQTKFQQGVILHQQGKLADAEHFYEEVLRAEPIHFGALHLLGIIALQTRRTARGVELIKKALRFNSNDSAKYNDLGMGLVDLQLFDEALANYDKAIALRPDFAEAHFNRGNALSDMKRFYDALSSYDKALVLRRDFARAHNNRGNALQELKRFEEALASYDKAIALNPHIIVTHNNRGNALKELKRFEDALASYDKAIALKPDYAEAYNHRGAALRELQRFNEALASYDKATALKPDYAEAYNNQGNTLQELKRFEEALASYDKAIALRPHFVATYNNRGNALQELKRFEEALASYDKAIALKPDYAEAYFSRGSALSDLRLYDEALAMFGKALALKPDLAEAFLGRGKIFYELKRYDEASFACDKAIAIKPDLAEARFGYGNVLSDLKHYEEAFAAYDKALALKPDLAEVEGRRLHTKMLLCDWRNFDAECKHLIASVNKETLATPPFPFLAISASSNEQLSCAKLFNKRRCPPFDKPVWQGERYNHDRIRVAYLSADFCDHPISYLLAGVFEQHDRKRFETTAISFGPNSPSEMLTRLQGSFDRFIDVKDQSDIDVAKLLKTLEVDTAVDLMGYTKDSRFEILAHRPSPIQVNYLGYPGTMGAEYIDYIIGDRFVIPDIQRRQYSEKIIYLPDTFQANDFKRKTATGNPRRDETGLPENEFVFCSFNNSYKITPALFDIWMRLLQKIDGSVLWLLAESTKVEHNLRKEAESRGVNSARLIFAPRVSYSDYLARYRLADLFLDTFPFNAGTTASDALWAGLPLVTCSGEAFASRMAGSVLGAIGMSEMVTESMTAYEALACKLARNPDLMTSTRMKLARNRDLFPLFNTQLFTKHLEAAYITMYERYQAGFAPDYIVVQN